MRSGAERHRGRNGMNTREASSRDSGTATTDNGLIAIDKVANKIRFYDPQTLREIKVLDSPEPTVHELALSADRSLAFVPLYGDGIYGSNRNPNNKILVIDLSRQAVADTIALGEYVAPHGMTATADGKLWVVCDIPNTLLCVDPLQRRIEAVYDNPAKGAHLVEKTPDGRKLYVSAKEGDLAAFDVGRRAFTAAIPVRGEGIVHGNGSGSEGLAFTPDGGRLLAIDNHTGDIHVIDSASDRAVDRVPLQPHVPTNPKRSRLAKLMFSRDGRHLVATSYATGLAWIMDAADYRAQTVVPVAKGPMGIAFPAVGGTAIVSSHDSGLLTRIDLESKRVLDAHDGGAGVEVLSFY
jgi:DNA-binding beta-propeller fold protein YncE